MSDKSNLDRRRKRVKRLKRLILTFFFLIITIPIALCIWLGCTLHGIRNDFAEVVSQYDAQLAITDELQEKLEAEKEARIAAEAELSEAAVSINIESDVEEVTEDFVKPEEPVEAVKKVYLTFDDGPSIFTEQILDILDSYGVKATFFVTGQAVSEHPERFLEIVNRGHSIGMHSYSHKYGEIYKSKDNFIKDFEKVKDTVTQVGGITPAIYRFPGGSSNTVSATNMDELCEYLSGQGVTYYDWNVSSGDASTQTLSAERIVANCLAGIAGHDESIVLLHDISTKYTTVAALPTIIEAILAMEDTEILPITDQTIAIQHRESKETR